MATVAQTVRVFIETHYRYHHTLSCRGRKHLHSPFARRLACTWHHQQPSVLCRRDEKIFFDRETGKLVARLSSEWNGGEARSLQGRSYQLYLHDNVLSETDMTAVHHVFPGIHEFPRNEQELPFTRVRHFAAVRH